MLLTNCLCCKQPIKSKWSKKFCSLSCSAKTNNSKKRKTVICFVCTESFTVPNWIKRVKYKCSICTKNKPIRPAKQYSKTKNCKICNNIFTVFKTKAYCSLQCKKQSVKKYTKTCQYCNNTYKAEKNISKYCSRSCRSRALKLHEYAHKKSGLSRSKIEEFIEKQLIKDFLNLKFVFNDKKTIGSELDIYIPQLKLAFELNGIFHYIPVYGENTLTKIQNRDKQKAILCFEQGIELVTINLGNCGFTKKFAKNVYQQIYQLIDKNKNRINCAV